MGVSAQGVDAYFDYAAFFAPGSGTYVETYIAFAGNSLHYILTPDSTLQASVEVTMLFKNVDKIPGIQHNPDPKHCQGKEQLHVPADGDK